MAKTSGDWAAEMDATAKRISDGPWDWQTATWQVGTGMNAYLTALDRHGWYLYSITPAGEQNGHDHLTFVHQRATDR